MANINFGDKLKDFHLYFENHKKLLFVFQSHEKYLHVIEKDSSNFMSIDQAL